MKKICLIICLIGLFILSSCGDSKYKSKKSIPSDTLERFYLEKLPKADAEKGKYEESMSTPRLFLKIEQGNFDEYSKEVYDYLLNLSFSYFGYKDDDEYFTVGKRKIYKFMKSDNFDDFKEENDKYYEYAFVYTKNPELVEGVLCDAVTLTLRYYYETQVHKDQNDKRGNFEYNSIVTISDNISSYIIKE